MLGQRNLIEHFSKHHKKKLLEQNVEFTCTQGKNNQQNKDNMFIISDGDIKIFGVFDGHGVNGN